MTSRTWDVVDNVGSVQSVDSFGGTGDAWHVDTDQSRIMSRAGGPSAGDWLASARDL